MAPSMVQRCMDSNHEWTSTQSEALPGLHQSKSQLIKIEFVKKKKKLVMPCLFFRNLHKHIFASKTLPRQCDWHSELLSGEKILDKWQLTITIQQQNNVLKNTLEESHFEDTYTQTHAPSHVPVRTHTHMFFFRTFRIYQMAFSRQTSWP